MCHTAPPPLKVLRVKGELLKSKAPRMYSNFLCNSLSPPRTKGADDASCLSRHPAKETTMGSVTMTDWSLAARCVVFDCVIQITRLRSEPERSSGNMMCCRRSAAISAGLKRA
eukprot:4752394-Amphidinium_carterae.1